METENKNIERKEYEFGDLYVKCSCGVEAPIKGGEGIYGGVRVELYTLSDHEFTLKCEKCGTKITLFFKESENKDELRNKLSIKKETDTVKEEEEEVNNGLLEEIQEKDGNN